MEGWTYKMTFFSLFKGNVPLFLQKECIFLKPEKIKTKEWFFIWALFFHSLTVVLKCIVFLDSWPDVRRIPVLAV